MTEERLIKEFHQLKPWSKKNIFLHRDWRNYVQVAKYVQKSDMNILESALKNFILDVSKEKYNGTYESESKVFILIRVVFNLPNRVLARQRLSFKGWINWPKPDENGKVNLSWPVFWNAGIPLLEDEYVGSLGESYDAWGEFVYFKKNYKFRKLE